jgi:hypothetical protein
MGRLNVWALVLRQRGALSEEYKLNKLGFWLVTVILVLGLSACNLSFSPERAAVQAVLDMNGTPGHMQVDPATIRVLQKQSLQDNEMVLVAFQAIQENGQLSECLFMHEVHRGPLGWATGGGGGGCGPAGGSGEPLGIGAGRHGGTDGRSSSHVAGRVYEEGIVALEVTWDDGQRQRVQVVNASYLAARAGLHDYAQLQALNAKDEVVYIQENPPTAPGKGAGPALLDVDEGNPPPAPGKEP